MFLLIGALILIGVFLIFLEIFLPGAILGMLGGLSLLAGIVLGFITYGWVQGIIITCNSIILTVFVIAIAYTQFSRSFMGRHLILRE
jgi:membrane-bound serine protease (ClpP class)